MQAYACMIVIPADRLLFLSKVSVSILSY